MPDVALAAYELIRITESIAAGDPQGREDLFQRASRPTIPVKNRWAGMMIFETAKNFVFSSPGM